MIFCLGLQTALRQMERSPSARERAAAIRGLLQYSPGRWSQQVIECLHGDESLRVRQAAYYALREAACLHKPVLLTVVDQDVDEGLRYAAMSRIVWQRDDVPRLVKLLRDPHATVRLVAIETLSRLNERRVVADVLAALERESEPFVVDKLLQLLGKIGGPQAVARLATWAVEGDDFQRVHAISSLCQLGAEEELPVMEAALRLKRVPQRLEARRVGQAVVAHTMSDLVRKSLRESPNERLRQRAALR